MNISSSSPPTTTTEKVKENWINRQKPISPKAIQELQSQRIPEKARFVPDEQSWTLQSYVTVNAGICHRVKRSRDSTKVK